MSVLSIGQPGKKNINPLVAYAIIVGVVALVFILGIAVGKLFFWNNYSSLSRAEKQLAIAQERLKKSPENPAVITNLGWAYFQKGDYNRALLYYKQAVDKDSKYFPAHLNLGMAYMQKEKWDVAIESFKKAIAIESKSAVAHLNLGISYNKTKKYNEAIKELTIADKLNPGSVEIIYQIGVAYEKLGNMEEAKYQYKSALDFDPKYLEAQKALDRLKK